MTPNPRKGPTSFRALSREECVTVLSRNHVGRLAFAFPGRVDIQPLTYVMIGDDLAFRTTFGTKVSVLQHHPWVAFEVDETDRQDFWYSVVVRGTIYPVDDSGTAEERNAFAIVLDRLGLEQDTVGEDSGAVLLRLHTEDMTGREARVG